MKSSGMINRRNFGKTSFSRMNRQRHAERHKTDDDYMNKEQDKVILKAEVEDYTLTKIATPSPRFS